ncbi:MAG: HD-GYP domain-containing protein [Gammaproteobacteria bacterium]|nr:HD-GYP domain-containing protein [Gammaproteobacteria bacterium]
MVDSIVRNPDAMQWLTNLRKRDEYTAIHSMNVCIFALSFGRYLGLGDAELNELGIGALLHDIGKMRMPLEILNKEGRLSDEEYDIVRQHAQHGYEILQQTPGLPPSALEVAYSHHERKKGNGYPRGLTNDQIPLFAKMVAIVDIYDAITSDRAYHHGMNTMDALKNMFEWREHELDSDLVERFISCLGIYPIGSLVELNTDEVGIVISVAQGRRLTPMVMLVRNAEKKTMLPPKTIDLSGFMRGKSEQPVEILKVLEPNAYGIDVREYIQQEISA